MRVLCRIFTAVKVDTYYSTEMVCLIWYLYTTKNNSPIMMMTTMTKLMRILLLKMALTTGATTVRLWTWITRVGRTRKQQQKQQQHQQSSKIRCFILQHNFKKEADNYGYYERSLFKRNPWVSSAISGMRYPHHFRFRFNPRHKKDLSQCDDNKSLIAFSELSETTK